MRDKIKKEQLNNKGFSLIELIVIMIIVVILATAVVVAFVNSDTQKTKTSASLVSKYLDNVLNYSLTKGDAYFEIRYDSASGKYYVEDSEGHSEKLASGVKVSYDVENRENANNIPIDESNDTLKFSFNRTNGSFAPTESGDYIKNIYLKSNDSTKVVHLYTKTGAYEIEDL